MNKKEVAKILRDYYWIINEIKRQRKLLEDVGIKMTGTYGLEGSMPHGTGTSDPVANETIRRDKKYTWIAKLEEKALYVQSRACVIDDERERAVLECMMDGMSMVAIQRHMGISKSHLFRIRDAIIERMISYDKEA